MIAYAQGRRCPPFTLLRCLSFHLPLFAVEDWDGLEALLSHGFKQLRADVTEHPLLMSEAVYTPPAQREKMVSERREERLNREEERFGKG